MERKKIINICPSFSAVTNINSWRAKAALSNLVPLVMTKDFHLPANRKSLNEKKNYLVYLLLFAFRTWATFAIQKIRLFKRGAKVAMATFCFICPVSFLTGRVKYDDRKKDTLLGYICWKIKWLIRFYLSSKLTSIFRISVTECRSSKFLRQRLFRFHVKVFVLLGSSKEL